MKLKFAIAATILGSSFLGMLYKLEMLNLKAICYMVGIEGIILALAWSFIAMANCLNKWTDEVPHKL